MKRIAIASTLALSLALAACGGGDDAAEADTAEAEAHDPTGYASDLTGDLTDEIGPDGLGGLNEQLAGHHSDSGNDVHILVVGSTNGEPVASAAAIARASGDSDALIYIAAGDQAIAVVGEGIDEAEGDAVAASMVEHFDSDDIGGGFTAGIDGTLAAMSN
jgi:uncharacterized membrane protein YgcG